MSQLPRKSWRLFAIAAIAGAVTGFALPPAAHAASDHVLDFTFSDEGKVPTIEKMRSYILGCLPNKTWITGLPEEASGPWDVTLPKKGKTGEYSNRDIETRLMSQVCNSVRPKSVEDVAVTDG
jgi:hypothetical protein